MSKKLICIMLIDDDEDDNFYHERVIEKYSSESVVVVKNSGLTALEYLKLSQSGSGYPDIIFLDINMPRMNGLEFLKEYNRLNTLPERSPVIIMLTTSANPDDISNAISAGASDYMTKPLTAEALGGVIAKYIKNIADSPSV